jgi:plasmid stabilization system protein ParE
MTYVLRFLPEVEADVLNGRLWYEEKSPGPGEEFLRVFYTCSQELTRNPTMHRKMHWEFRRCLLRRFPYAIYFQIEDDRVIVFGLFHCARDPRRLRRQLGERER